MGERVVALEARGASFDRALEAYRAARFVACTRSLHGQDGLAERTLRARALLRLDRSQEAAQALAAVPGPGETSHQPRAVALIVRATAAMRSRDFRAAEEDFAAARIDVYSTPNPDLEGEFEYYCAILRWAQGDFVGGEAGARQVLQIEGSPDGTVPDDPKAFVTPLSVTRARAMMILAFEAAREGRFRAHVDLLLHALAELDCGDWCDPYCEAVLLRDLAFGARELGLSSVATLARKRTAAMSWTPELAEQHAHVLRSLGWCAGLAGDHLSALRSLRLSADLAPAPTWRLLALTERSYLARALDQSILAEEELRLAQDLSRSIEWERTAGEESIGLLMLAYLTADRDPAAAQAWVARYDSLRENSSPLLFGRPDPRARAVELFAKASVAEAEGTRSRAIALARDALALWDRVGCTWRAALAAMYLAEVTGNAEYFDYVERESARYPRAWFALRHERAKARRLPLAT